MDQTFAKWQPTVLSLLRFMSGLLLMQHGTAKLLGFPSLPMFADLQIASMVGAAGVIELVGGTVQLWSGEGTGTSIVIQVPLGPLLADVDTLDEGNEAVSP